MIEGTLRVEDLRAQTGKSCRTWSEATQILSEARAAALARAREGRQARTRDAMRQQSHYATRALTVTLQQRQQALHCERAKHEPNPMRSTLCSAR